MGERSALDVGAKRAIVCPATEPGEEGPHRSTTPRQAQGQMVILFGDLGPRFAENLKTPNPSFIECAHIRRIAIIEFFENVTPRQSARVGNHCQMLSAISLLNPGLSLNEYGRSFSFEALAHARMRTGNGRAVY